MGRYNLPETVVRQIQRTVLKAFKEAEQQDKLSTDKMKTISKLLNSYVALLEVTGGTSKEKVPEELTEEWLMENGLPGYYESMARGNE